MLTETVFRSDALPAAERFGHWRERLARTHAPIDLRSEHADDFFAHQRLLELGPVRVWPTRYQPLMFRRTESLIRRSDPEQLHIALPLHGANHVTQACGTATYGPYDLHVFDSSQPFELYSAAEDGLFHGVGMEVPKSLLPLRADRVGRLHGRPMSGREGVGVLVTQFVQQLVSDTASYRHDDGHRLGGVLVALLTALLAHELDAEASVPPESRGQALALRVRAFIREHLGEPGLGPAEVAAAHHISRSYLYRLFEDENVSVAEWIRRERLERARVDLADPAMRDQPVYAVAARWCFPNASVFSRAFSAAYGVPPGEYRRLRAVGGNAAGGGDVIRGGVVVEERQLLAR